MRLFCLCPLDGEGFLRSWSLRHWAARGLDLLNAPAARQALWDARARPFADPAEGDRFLQMLDDLKSSK